MSRLGVRLMASNEAKSVGSAAEKVLDTVFQKGTDTELVELEGCNLVREESRTVKVYAQGDTLTETSNDLFKALRAKVFSDVDAPVIQMTAEQVVFDRVIKNEYTEHFLGAFMPRQRVRYDVTASITVSLKYLKSEGSDK